MTPVTRDTAHNSDILYHYTGLDALRGIAEERRLWATDYRYLNDSSEARYVFQEALHYKDGVVPRPRYSDFWEKTEFGGELGNCFGIYPGTPDRAAPRPPHFVSCLSEQEDDLNQWRAYSRGGYGVAIGFDRTSLLDLLRQAGGGATLSKCVYGDPGVIHAKVKECIDNAATFGPTRYVAAGMASATSFYDWALNYKQKAFVAEAEWRIVLRATPQQIRYRVRESMLVPFTTFPPGQHQLDFPDLIADVIIGPNPNPGLNEESIASALGIQRQRVRTSLLTLRTW